MTTLADLVQVDSAAPGAQAGFVDFVRLGLRQDVFVLIAVGEGGAECDPLGAFPLAPTGTEDGGTSDAVHAASQMQRSAALARPELKARRSTRFATA